MVSITQRRRLWPLALAVAAGAGAMVAAVVFRDPLTAGAEALLSALRGMGPWGPIAFALVYVAATVLMLPGTPLTLGAGLVWGVVGGTALVSVASVGGATLAFLLGRGAARGWVESLAERHPRFAAIDDAVGRSGWRIVLLTRLSPLFPFNVLNYLYGATRVGLRDYVLASWVGMLPGTLLYVYLGAVAGEVVDSATGETAAAPAAQRVAFYVGLLATIGVTALATRLARRALTDAVPTDAEPSSDGVADRPAGESPGAAP